MKNREVFIDFILLNSPDNLPFFLADILILHPDFIEEEKRDVMRFHAIRKEIIEDCELNFKYFARTGANTHSFSLTDKGRSAKQAGGHIKYLETLAAKEAITQSRQSLTDEKLVYDLKNAKRIFNTYWWTFGFSVAALLLSIFNFIYNLFFNKN